jgi:hypothetical protein
MIPGSANPLLLTSADSGYAIERSLRFNSGDSAYLSRNFAAGNRKKWTWSGWFKLSKLGQRNYIFTNWNSSGQLSLYLEWTNSDKIRIGEYSSSAWEWQLDSTSQFRDSSAWYHLVVAVDTTQSTASDRVKVYINGEQLTSFSPSNYPSQNKDTYVNQAVEHNIGRLQTTEADFYLADVHFIDGQALAPTDFGETDEFGVWQPKAFEGTYGPLVDTSQTWSSGMKTTTTANTSYSTTGRTTTFPDSLLATVPFDADLTNYLYSQTGAAGTWLYVEFGTALANVTSIVFSTEYSCPGGVIKLNGTDVAVNQSNIGGGFVEVSVTGTIPSSLTEIAIQGYTGSARLKYLKINNKYLLDSGVTVVDNSFHLDFADNSSNAALGTDTSGNSNTWTVNNLSAGAGSSPTAKQNFDVVTYTGNGGTQSISSLAFQPDLVWTKIRSSTGKHRLTDSVRGTTNALRSDGTDAEFADTNVTAFNSDGFDIGANGNASGYTYVAWCWKAGGAATTIAAGSLNSSAYDQSYTWSSSTGYVDSDGTQSSANIFDGNLTTYVSGRPSSTVVTLANSITAQSKIRFYGSWEDSSNSRWAVNGTATNAVPLAYTNNTTFGWSEPTNLTFPLTITSVGALGGNSGAGGRFVAVEVDGKILADSTVTPTTNFPSIASSVSANTSYGFSVVSWTGNSTAGATIGHSLSTAPKMIIVKNRDRSTYGDWVIGHDAINGFQDGNQLYFTSAAVASGEGFFNNTSPTSSVFTVKNNYQVNYSGDNYVAYVWSEVAGFSKFGTYTGNGSTSGPTVTLGFKPRYIILKSTSGSRSWCIYDTARDTNATNDNNLFANNANAESSDPLHNITILDDGFKLSTGNVDRNGSGETYVYAAFAATVPAGGPDADSLVDTPSNAATPTDTGVGNEVVGNYCTLNPIDGASTGKTFSNGNLEVSITSSSTSNTYGTIAVSSGKWYWEIESGGIQGEQIGIADAVASPRGTSFNANGYSYEAYQGRKVHNNSYSSYGASFADGDIIGIALDMDAGQVTFYKNGTSQGVAFTGLSGKSMQPMLERGSGFTMSYICNFGQRAFSHPVSGYKALCTSNLPEPTIADGGKYFDTKLWTGNASSKAITGYNFSPDFVWIKNRSGAYNHGLFDIVRGANKVLLSSGTNAETTYTQQLNSFDSSGFTLGDNSDSGNYVNVNNSTYVGWAWDAGSSNTTIAAGSLNSSVYNQSQSAWQNYLTTTNGNGFPDSNHPVTWAFDGHLNHHTYTGDDDIYFTPSGGVSFTITSQVRIRSYWDTTVTVETSAGTFGPVTSSSSGTWQWTTVSCSGTLTKITIRRVNGANLSGIEIDGILLVNSGITPATNVPSIASTVRASASSGFSIVSYNGTGANATFGHGLNAAPEFVIVKTRTSGSINWTVWHEAIAATDYLTLNTSNAKGTAAAVWNSTAPTSSVINVGTDVGTNKSGDNYIAYCFAPVEGYSAMGSYTGNNSADGPFVYTGFKPRWIMIKATSFSEHWYIYDTKRNPFNVNQYPLLANSSNGGLSYEGIADGGQAIDILSNGFKLRGAWLTNNGSQNYIYAAFAENPFKTARAR